MTGEVFRSLDAERLFACAISASAFTR